MCTGLRSWPKDWRRAKAKKDDALCCSTSYNVRNAYIAYRQTRENGVTDTKRPQWTAEDREQYLRAQIALGIVKATPKARPPVGNGGGVKLPEKERPLSGETMQAMSRR